MVGGKIKDKSTTSTKPFCRMKLIMSLSLLSESFVSTEASNCLPYSMLNDLARRGQALFLFNFIKRVTKCHEHKLVDECICRALAHLAQILSMHVLHWIRAKKSEI